MEEEGKIMKKKLIFLVLGLSILLAGGCGKKDEVKNDTNQKNETKEKDYVVGDHIKLGQYKGVEVTVEYLEVTEEDIEYAIQMDLEEAATLVEVTDRTAVESGDTVNIDFKGMLDGVAFEGGTATDFDLEIGSGQFIEGFEEKLIGVNVGETVELDLKFPETYNNEELAGQDVVFEVTVNAIQKMVTPELTDEFVKEFTDFETVDAYRASIRERLEKEYAETMKRNKTRNVLNAIIDNAEIISYPESITNRIEENMISEQTSYASMYGMELEDFLLGMYGMTLEQFNIEIASIAEEAAAQQLVIEAIMEAENIEFSEQEFQEGVSRLAKEFGHEEEEFVSTYGEDAIRETLIWEKVLDYLSAEAIEV